MSYRLDDAAFAALLMLGLGQPTIEHVGLLYQNAEGGVNRTATVTRRDSRRASGAFSIPAGSLRGLFHNHPTIKLRGAIGTDDASSFSTKDIAESKRLGVPSYISAGNDVRRYDPSTNQTTDVLAQFPIKEMLQHIARRNPIMAAYLTERDNGRAARR
jgi:hypothetical protein